MTVPRIVVVVVIAVALAVWWFAGLRRDASVGPAVAAPTPPIPLAPVLTDDDLRVALDGMLDAVHPEDPDNAYLPDFARDRLRWMWREHAASRLEVAFLSRTATGGSVPDDLLMATWRTQGKATIMIVKPRFAELLHEGGPAVPPFSRRQRNDFIVGLVHEIVHLQNPDADPTNPDLRAAEEARAWREVTLHVVRPLRLRNEPMRQRFREVDDALRACGDRVPCPLLERLVRLRL